MAEKGRTAKSAITLTVVSAVTKPLGFLKEIVIAAYFGATALKDAFLIAWAIPNIMAAFVVEGLNQVLVPIFIEKIHQKNEKEAWKIASIISNVIIIIFFIISLLAVILAPLLVNLIAPNAPAETKIYALKMTRILSFSILALAISALLTSILNSYRRFIPPALTFGLMNIVIIAFTVTFYKSLGIYALVLGTLFGAVSMVLLQIPPLLKELVHFQFSLDLKNEGVRSFGRLMAPMVLGTFVFGLMNVLEKVFASGLSVGSISSLDYGFRVIHFVFGLLVPTVTTAAFPTISLYALDKVKDRFVSGVWSTIKMVELFIIPISVFLIGFNYYVVKIVYERGLFGPEATLLSARLLAVFALGMFASSAAWVLFHAFYALKDTSVRVKASLIILGVYVLSNLVLIRYLGIFGIAFANSLSWVIGLLFLLAWFTKEVPQKGLGKLLLSGLAMVAAALISIMVARGIWFQLVPLELLPLVKLLFFCLIAAGYFLLYLFIYLVIFRDKEAQMLFYDGFQRIIRLR